MSIESVEKICKENKFDYEKFSGRPLNRITIKVTKDISISCAFVFSSPLEVAIIEKGNLVQFGDDSVFPYFDESLLVDLYALLQKNGTNSKAILKLLKSSFE